MSVEAAWQAARRLHHLPDTQATREAFYCGARHAFDFMLKDDSSEGLTEFNNDLHSFATARVASFEGSAS